MVTPHDIDVRRAPGRGWGWRVFRFTSGQMQLVAYGSAPCAWMARLDARRCVSRNRHLLVVPKLPRYSD